jgi:hypothetical protein
MKTTTKRSNEVEVSVVRFEQGDDWARFEMRSDSAEVLFTNSLGGRIQLNRDSALTQMVALTKGRWERSTSGATLPAWAA